MILFIALTLWTIQYIVVAVFLFRKYYNLIMELDTGHPLQAISYTLMILIRISVYTYIGIKILICFIALGKEKKRKLAA